VANLAVANLAVANLAVANLGVGSDFKMVWAFGQVPKFEGEPRRSGKGT
jgi:hypothetical protein